MDSFLPSSWNSYTALEVHRPTMGSQSTSRLLRPSQSEGAIKLPHLEQYSKNAPVGGLKLSASQPRFGSNVPPGKLRSLGWPPAGPEPRMVVSLRKGHVLLEQELQTLKTNFEKARALAARDPEFAVLFRRAQQAEDEIAVRQEAVEQWYAYYKQRFFPGEERMQRGGSTNDRGSARGSARGVRHGTARMSTHRSAPTLTFARAPDVGPTSTTQRSLQTSQSIAGVRTLKKPVEAFNRKSASSDVLQDRTAWIPLAGPPATRRRVAQPKPRQKMKQILAKPEVAEMLSSKKRDLAYGRAAADARTAARGAVDAAAAAAQAAQEARLAAEEARGAGLTELAEYEELSTALWDELVPQVKYY